MLFFFPSSSSLNLLSLSLSLSLSFLLLSLSLPSESKKSPAYHLFIFYLPPLFRHSTFRVPAAARVARSRWLDAVAAAPRDSATQTYAVQSIRNSIMAASFAASTCGLIAVSGLLPAILDGAKIGRLRELAALDPITRALTPSSSDSSASAPLSPAWPSVEFKLSLMELVIISSFIAYMQCIRFNVYLK
jgi:Protein of unknown function, DUF599